MRVGLIAQKIGMSSWIEDTGEATAVTILKLENCTVLENKSEDNDGYNAVVVGYGDAKLKNLNRPQKKMYESRNLDPRKNIKEFRVDSKDALLEEGSQIDIEHIIPGQYIDVTGRSIGKGFAGAMKRHNFSGLEATHGVSTVHRSHGATGGCQDPGKVFKNKKMAGHMGDRQVTKQNLKVLSIDAEDGLIFVKGAVPGAKKSEVIVRDSVKKSPGADAPYPAKTKKHA
jgi:large subunit ribosomal protein L3